MRGGKAGIIFRGSVSFCSLLRRLCGVCMQAVLPSASCYVTVWKERDAFFVLLKSSKLQSLCSYLRWQDRLDFDQFTLRGTDLSQCLSFQQVWSTRLVFLCQHRYQQHSFPCSRWSVSKARTEGTRIRLLCSDRTVHRVRHLSQFSERENHLVHDAQQSPAAAAVFAVLVRDIPLLPAGPRFSLQIHRSCVPAHLPRCCRVWVSFGCFFGIYLTPFIDFIESSTQAATLWNQRAGTELRFYSNTYIQWSFPVSLFAVK